jgi:hypothetical protein
LEAVDSSICRGPLCVSNFARSAASITARFATDQSGRTSSNRWRSFCRPMRAASSGLSAAAMALTIAAASAWHTPVNFCD